MGIDGIFQFVAGALDLQNVKLEKKLLNKSKQKNATVTSKLQLDQYCLVWCWKLASAVVFLTIGTQVIIFNIAHYDSKRLINPILLRDNEIR